MVLMNNRRALDTSSGAEAKSKQMLPIDTAAYQWGGKCNDGYTVTFVQECTPLAL